MGLSCAERHLQPPAQPFTPDLSAPADSGNVDASIAKDPGTSSAPLSHSIYTFNNVAPQAGMVDQGGEHIVTTVIHDNNNSDDNNMQEVEGLD